MSHTTTIGNFSVQSVNFDVPQGDTITSVNPTATLTLVPDPGYQIDASDFSYTSGPSQIISVVFSQSGDNVLCVVTFDTTYVMPGNNINLPICIEGSATTIDYTLSGVVRLKTGGNTTPSSGDTAYSASGSEGDVVQVFSYTLTAASGYYFPLAPTGSIITGDPGNYSVTTSNTYDAEGNLTAVTFTANYTFPGADVSGNVFSIKANAAQIPVTVYEITSYTISKTDLPGESATTRNMKIFGTPGAQFSLTVVNEDGTSVLSSPLSNVVITNSGFYEFNITFPAVTDNDEYDFVLTGDGVVDNFDSSGQQPSTFTIYQYLEITVTFGVNSTNSQLNISPDVVYTYPPNQELDQNDSNYNFQAVFTITAGSTINVSSNPLTTDWPNLIGANNGGTDIQLSSSTGQLTNNNLTYTLTVSGTTSETGTQNVLSEIDIDTFISTNFVPEAYPVSKTIQEDEVDPANLVVTLLGYDADPGDTLTYEILTLPTNGDLYASTDTTFTTPLTVGVISGSSILYKPDANYNGTDTFNYNTTDGTATSSTATALITVTPVNDAPIFTSTPPTYTGIVGGTYTYNFTYEDIDNTDQEVAITTQSTLPAGWTLTDNQDGTGTLTGPVPAGLTTIVLIATDPGNLTDSQTINVSAAYDILGDMEFLVSYRSSTVASGTGESPKTSSPITISAEPTGLANSHTCARADFVLAAETTNSNNDTVRYRIGAVSLNNAATYNQYKLDPAEEANRPAGTTQGTLVAAQYLDFTSGGESVDIGNVPVGAYNSSNPRSYYVDGVINTGDRHQYLTIPQSIINAMTNPITGTASGVFTLKLLPDSFDLLDANGNATINPILAAQGSLDIHSDAAWLQVFKRNSADTNQEEVTDSSGNSFSVTTASNVSINIFTGDVTVS
jgi:hypothetical protein